MALEVRIVRGQNQEPSADADHGGAAAREPIDAAHAPAALAGEGGGFGGAGDHLILVNQIMVKLHARDGLRAVQGAAQPIGGKQWAPLPISRSPTNWKLIQLAMGTYLAPLLEWPWRILF